MASLVDPTVFISLCPQAEEILAFELQVILLGLLVSSRIVSSTQDPQLQEGRERKRRGKTDRDTFMYDVCLVSIIYIVSFDMVTPCVLISSLGSFS